MLAFSACSLVNDNSGRVYRMTGPVTWKRNLVKLLSLGTTTLDPMDPDGKYNLGRKRGPVSWDTPNIKFDSDQKMPRRPAERYLTSL